MEWSLLACVLRIDVLNYRRHWLELILALRGQHGCDTPILHLLCNEEISGIYVKFNDPKSANS